MVHNAKKNAVIHVHLISSLSYSFIDLTIEY